MRTFYYNGSMIRFDSIDKKPKVWNIAILSALTVVLLGVQLLREPVDLTLVFVTLCVCFGLTILFLIDALIRQLKYNPYSYNTIYYIGFSLFAAIVLYSTVLLYDDLHVDAPDLKIPHPLMFERDFVMVPLREICNDIPSP